MLHSYLEHPLLFGYRQFLRSRMVERSKRLRGLRKNAESFGRGLVTLSIDGLKLRLDLSRGTQKKIFWSHEEYEPALQWTIRELLPEDAVMIDCGANAGLFGFLALTRPRTQVVFIEPHPRLAEQLRENIALNRLEDRASVVECAASDQAGTSHLIQAIAEQDGSHSLQRNKYSDPEAEALPVQLRRLDEILKDMPRIDLLKVDAEFHDFEVLQGLGDRIKDIKLIYIEMSYDQFDPCFEYLSSRGYRPYGTLKATRKKLSNTPTLIQTFNGNSRKRDLLWSRTAL
jgi:FkbM family methyltransferase